MQTALLRVHDGQNASTTSAGLLVGSELALHPAKWWHSHKFCCPRFSAFSVRLHSSQRLTTVASNAEAHYKTTRDGAVRTLSGRCHDAQYRLHSLAYCFHPCECTRAHHIQIASPRGELCPGAPVCSCSDFPSSCSPVQDCPHVPRPASQHAIGKIREHSHERRGF